MLIWEINLNNSQKLCLQWSTLLILNLYPMLTLKRKWFCTRIPQYTLHFCIYADDKVSHLFLTCISLNINGSIYQNDFIPTISYSRSDICFVVIEIESAIFFWVKLICFHNCIWICVLPTNSSCSKIHSLFSRSYLNLPFWIFWISEWIEDSCCLIVMYVSSVEWAFLFCSINGTGTFLSDIILDIAV